MGERMYGEDYGIVVGTFPESAVEATDSGRYRG